MPVTALGSEGQIKENTLDSRRPTMVKWRSTRPNNMFVLLFVELRW